MKTMIKYFVPIASTLLLGLSVSGAKLKLETTDVKEFTDFSTSGSSETKTRPIFLQEVEDSIADILKEEISDKLTVSITFTDVDMAGDIQPWRNRNNADIRYIEDIYPPRLSFDYSISGENEETVASGSEKLSDLNFLFGNMKIGRYQRQFYYETDLLKEWIKRDLPKIIAKANSDLAKN